MKGPDRCTTLPEEPEARKQYPIASGFLDYFPDAIAAVSHLSWKANEQHNPGEPVHWNRSKSTDEADTLMRHLLQRGTTDTDGIRHSAKVAWRALAMLQKEIEEEKKADDERLSPLNPPCGTYVWQWSSPTLVTDGSLLVQNGNTYREREEV